MTSPEHDDLVARALRDLPVPGHRTSFWSDLDDAVAEIAKEGTSEGGPPGNGRLDTGELPTVRSLSHGRRRSSGRGAWLAVAAALLVVAAAVGITQLGEDGGGGDAELADAPTSETTVAPLATGEPSVTGPPATATTAAPEVPLATEGPEAVAQAWIDALGAGDTATAASLLGPRTLAYLQQLGADPTGTMAESQEGYGAWAGAADVTYRAIPLGTISSLDDARPVELAVVTVSGTHPGEGSPEARVDALPMLDDGAGWRLEHLAYQGSLDRNAPDFTLPEEVDARTLGAMAPGDEINVFLPAQGTVFFQIDGGEVATRATSTVADAPFALHNPPQDLAPGAHHLLVVAVGVDHTIVHFSGTFEVRG